jgi:hypothetical protein
MVFFFFESFFFLLNEPTMLGELQLPLRGTEQILWEYI